MRRLMLEFSRRRKDAQALYAAVGGGYDLDAQAGGFEQNNLAGKRDAALDLADQTAERGGFVGLAESAQAGLLAEELRQTIDGEVAGDQPDAAGFALRLGIVIVLIVDFADNLFEQVLDGDQTGDASMLVDDDAHVLLVALHLTQ